MRLFISIHKVRLILIFPIIRALQNYQLFNNPQINISLKTQSMQKWQQKKKQKAHQSIIQNAKSTLRRYSNSRDKSLNVSRAKPIQNTKQQIPINKILQIFQLQQYVYLLNLYKFPQNLARMDINSTISQMVGQVQEKDQERFSSLLNTLVVMTKALGTSAKATPKMTQKSKKIFYPPPQPPGSSQSKQMPSSMPKSDKTNSKFRIKVKAPGYTSQKHEELTNQNPIKTRNSSKQIQILSDKTKKRQKSISHLLNGKRKAIDDLSLIHDFGISNKYKQGTLKNIKHQSSIIKKLTQKLSQLQHPDSSSHNDDIKLDVKKIQQMYLSFDSATITSNITNIDLQQIIQCYAKQILSILAQAQVKCLVQNNEQRIKQLLRQSFLIVREQQRETQITSPQVNRQNVLNPQKQSSKNQSSSSPHTPHTPHLNNIQASIQQQINLHQTFKQQQSEQQQISNHISIQLREDIKRTGAGTGMMGSSIWGNNYIASVIDDFTCFDCNHFVENCQSRMPTLQDVKYFIELITMAGRLEKQIPILAYVYLQRLLKSVQEAKLTTRNWRNIVLITLIQASKIWDDRSLENNSFAKIIQPYTTLQINRLEKYLLFFIDYHLNIDQKQYSQSYFCLRKHATETYHTVHLARLDLKTIKRLQSNNAQDRIQKVSKKQFLRKCMNKSF